MSARIDQYIAQFQAASRDLIALVTDCSEEDWQRVSPGEGWTVAAIAHHVALRNGVIAGMIDNVLAGSADVPHISRADLLTENATHAEEYAAVSKEEVLALLRDNGDAFVRTLGRIEDDAILDRAGEVFAGTDLCVDYQIEEVVIAHAITHAASIRATLAA
ncbi:MAG TPA: DinB family protein [Thermomicrobiales bacterium]|nr:DinB family protein [Thermomicrobiales bacterium]